MNAIRAMPAPQGFECAQCGYPLVRDERVACVRGLRGDVRWLHDACAYRICVTDDEEVTSAGKLIDHCALAFNVRPAVGDVVRTLRSLFPSTPVLVDVDDPPLDDPSQATIVPPPTIDDVVARLAQMRTRLESLSETFDKMQVLLEARTDP